MYLLGLTDLKFVMGIDSFIKKSKAYGGGQRNHRARWAPWVRSTGGEKSVASDVGEKAAVGRGTTGAGLRKRMGGVRKQWWVQRDARDGSAEGEWLMVWGKKQGSKKKITFYVDKWNLSILGLAMNSWWFATPSYLINKKWYEAILLSYYWGSYIMELRGCYSLPSKKIVIFASQN